MNLKLAFSLSVALFFCLNTTCVGAEYEYDPNGYVIFCLCMGRFGNQADHFLGAMAFAKLINRTFVIPPFRTFKNVPFSEWFRLDRIREYHRTIPAEDFMMHIAPKYWPVGERVGFCWLNSQTPISECKMKEGNPFGPFWNELGVDFDSYEKYSWDYSSPKEWFQQFPASKYPVLALKGAPAVFPVRPEHREYQKYLVWSDVILDEVNNYIQKTFGQEKFIGIHLRNGVDWKRACEHVGNGLPSFMASPQCLEKTNKLVTPEICFPTEEAILSKLKAVVERTKISNVYVATDQSSLKKQIESHLKEFNVKVHHNDPWLPVIDLAILGKSDYFIGNCVSSFTSFVKRERDLSGKISEFWGL